MWRVATGFLAAGILAAVFLAGTLAVPSGAAVTPQERAQARQALLVLSDFPKGWKSPPNLGSGNSNNSSIAGNVQMALCLGVSPSSLEFNPPQVQSPAFTNHADTVFVQNAVLVFRSTSFAHNEYAALSSPKAAGCIEAQEAGQASTETTFAPPPHISLEKLSGPRGTVSFGFSRSLGALRLAAVFSLFTHQQFVDAITAFSYDSGTNVHSLEQRLLNVARSRL